MGDEEAAIGIGDADGIESEDAVDVVYIGACEADVGAEGEVESAVFLGEVERSGAEMLESECEIEDGLRGPEVGTTAESEGDIGVGGGDRRFDGFSAEVALEADVAVGVIAESEGIDGRGEFPCEGSVGRERA